MQDADSTGALLVSSESFLQGTWLHLKLDAKYNDNGDVVLQAFWNDLEERPLDQEPNWQPIHGMPRFIDDATAINSGSLPFVGGYAGFGYQTTEVTRRVYMAHVSVWRQTRDA